MRKTYGLNLSIVGLLAASLIAPRLMPRGGGFAPTQSATLVIATTLLAAMVLAVVQAVYTLQRRRALPRHEVFLGLAPITLGILTVIGLIVFLRT